jgi:hypothetical protein
MLGEGLRMIGLNRPAITIATGWHVTNDQVHGGNIAEDISIVASYADKKRAAGWKHAFEVSYSILFEILRPEEDDISKQLLIVFNHRASHANN